MGWGGIVHYKVWSDRKDPCSDNQSASNFLGVSLWYIIWYSNTMLIWKGTVNADHSFSKSNKILLKFITYIETTYKHWTEIAKYIDIFKVIDIWIRNLIQIIVKKNKSERFRANHYCSVICLYNDQILQFLGLFLKVFRFTKNLNTTEKESSP